MYNLLVSCVALLMFPFNTIGQDMYEILTVPQKCQNRKYMYTRCCLFPPFFNRDVARNCGALSGVTFNGAANVTGFRRMVNHRCVYWTCLLTKYELTQTDDETLLDLDKYFEHLESWVELNPEFTNVMLRAKLECKHSFTWSMPIKVCEYFNFQACIRNFIEVNCPRVIQTEECLEVQKFYEECHEYYQ